MAMAAFVGYCVQANGGHWATKMTLGGAKWPSRADAIDACLIPFCRAGAERVRDAGTLPAASKWQIILFVWFSVEIINVASMASTRRSLRTGRHARALRRVRRAALHDGPQARHVPQSFSDAYAEGEGYPHPVPFDLFDPSGRPEAHGHGGEARAGAGSSRSTTAARRCSASSAS